MRALVGLLIIGLVSLTGMSAADATGTVRCQPAPPRCSDTRPCVAPRPCAPRPSPVAGLKKELAEARAFIAVLQERLGGMDRDLNDAKLKIAAAATVEVQLHREIDRLKAEHKREIESERKRASDAIAAAETKAKNEIAEAKKEAEETRRKADAAIKDAEEKSRVAVAAARKAKDDADKREKEASEEISKARSLQREAETRIKAVDERARVVEAKFKQVELLQQAAAKASGEELLHAENRMKAARELDTKATNLMAEAKSEKEKVAREKQELDKYESLLKTRWEAVFAGMRSVDPCPLQPASLTAPAKPMN